VLACSLCYFAKSTKTRAGVLYGAFVPCFVLFGDLELRQAWHGKRFIEIDTVLGSTEINFNQLRLVMYDNRPRSLGNSAVRLSEIVWNCPKRCSGAEPKSEPSTFRTVGQVRLGSAFGRTNQKVLALARPSVGQAKNFCPNEHPWYSPPVDSRKLLNWVFIRFCWCYQTVFEKRSLNSLLQLYSWDLTQSLYEWNIHSLTNVDIWKSLLTLTVVGRWRDQNGHESAPLFLKNRKFQNWTENEIEANSFLLTRNILETLFSPKNRFILRRSTRKIPKISRVPRSAFVFCLVHFF